MERGWSGRASLRDRRTLREGGVGAKQAKREGRQRSNVCSLERRTEDVHVGLKKVQSG